MKGGIQNIEIRGDRMVLNNTLQLPKADPKLACQLLDQAISKHQVLMLILGEEHKQIVEWADQLCNKTQTGDTNMRRVVWVLDPDATQLEEKITSILGGASPAVAVLNLYGNFACQLPEDGETVADIDPIQLETAFLKGHG